MSWLRSLRDADRGAVVVETALALTLLMALIFGTIEIGRAIQTSHALTEAARAGARTASSLPREDLYNEAAAAAVSAAILNSGGDPTPIEMTIYRADPVTGEPVSGTVQNCTQCYQYTWNPALEGGRGAFDLRDGPFDPEWDHEDQAACGEVSNTHYVGVWVRASFDLKTVLVSVESDLVGRTVMRLEPILGEPVCS